MTREEAINHLKTVAKSAIDSGYDSAIVDAVYMAREALEQEPCEDWYDVPSDEMTLGQARQAVKDLRKMWAERLEQEPCEDAVSREAVEDIVMWYDGQGEMLDEIQKLPSVQPKQKTGHWIEDDSDDFLWKCSECGKIHNTASNYCPSCGCLMDRNDFNTYIIESSGVAG